MEVNDNLLGEMPHSIELADGLKVFTHNDFENFSAPSSKGGQRKVLLAQTPDGEKVAIKVHRRHRLENMVVKQYHRLFENTQKMRPLNETERAFERRFKRPEEVIDKMVEIDWQKTLADPEFKSKHNDLVIASVTRGQQLANLSPMIPVPLGVYRTRTGLLGEVYKAYPGPMAVNHSNPEAAKPLTPEQLEYYDEQLAILQSHGVYETDDNLLESNVIVMGDGREDIMFAELP